jgi:hypothetical protein
MSNEAFPAEEIYSFTIKPLIKIGLITMSALSILCSFLSIHLLMIFFEFIRITGPYPVPNMPIITISIAFILQSIVLIFIAVFFLTQLTLRLKISTNGVELTSYWYRLSTTWDNVDKVDSWSFFALSYDRLRLKKPGKIEQRRSNRGLYRFRGKYIVVGVFSSPMGDIISRLLREYLAGKIS